MSVLQKPVIQWAVGGEAEIVAVDGVRLTVHSTKPFPPGAPVPGTLTLETAHPFTLKVAGSRKVAEGVWQVQGRLTTATSDVLAAFAQAAPPPR
jgi:hypothetical protein